MTCSDCPCGGASFCNGNVGSPTFGLCILPCGPLQPCPVGMACIGGICGPIGGPCVFNGDCASGCCMGNTCMAPSACSSSPDPSCGYCDNDCDHCETCTCYNGTTGVSNTGGEACGAGGTPPVAPDCSSYCQAQGYEDGSIWCCYQMATGEDYGIDCVGKALGSDCMVNGHEGTCVKVPGHIPSRDDCWHVSCHVICNHDGVKDPGEDCDGADLGPHTCVSEGYPNGTLSCTPDCTLNRMGCGYCGDGIRFGMEDCDGADLGGETCMSQGLGMGVLACHPGCAITGTDPPTTCAAPACTFDTSGCGAPLATPSTPTCTTGLPCPHCTGGTIGSGTCGDGCVCCIPPDDGGCPVFVPPPPPPCPNCCALGCIDGVAGAGVCDGLLPVCCQNGCAPLILP